LIRFQQIFERARFVITMAAHDGFEMTRDIDETGVSRKKFSNQLLIRGVQTRGHRTPGTQRLVA